MNENTSIIPEPQPGPLPPKQLISADRLLIETFREYLNHFWKYFAITAVVLLPLAGFTAWFNPENRPWYLLGAYIFIATLISFYPHIALLYLAREFRTSNPVKISDAYLTSVSLYLPFTLTMVMVMFMTYFGLILCVVPGLIALTVFCVADGVVVWEEKYNISALQRSLELTQKHFWPVLWIMVFFNLTIMVVTYLIAHLPSLFYLNPTHLIKSFIELAQSSSPLPWWYILYQELISAIFFPTNAIMTYILYFNLKELKEQKIELPLNL
jgi:hypothetical protein